MDLHSPKDKILLKNCIVVKLNQLRLEENKPNADVSAIMDEISYYENLRQILMADDTELLISTLNHSISKDSYIKFNKHILTVSPKELAKEYIELTKSLMLENNVYSIEKFEELKQAFYKGNENLAESSQNVLTEEEKKQMANIDLLFQQHQSAPLSALQFKTFATQLRDLIKQLGINKFQKSFDKTGKQIVDMQISYDTSEFSKPVYKTDFSLLDLEHQLTHEFVHAPASRSGFTSNYYQTLCYTYLEADKCTRNT